jgi:recombinational DNA repair protein RecR
MNIIEALKTQNARVSYGNKWLVVTEDEMFRVYEHPYRAKKAMCLIQTDSEDEAIEELLR